MEHTKTEQFCVCRVSLFTFGGQVPQPSSLAVQLILLCGDASGDLQDILNLIEEIVYE